MLLEAYVKGQQELLYVVPFVAKVLESSIRSVVSKFNILLNTDLSHLMRVRLFWHKVKRLYPQFLATWS